MFLPLWSDYNRVTNTEYVPKTVGFRGLPAPVRTASRFPRADWSEAQRS